MPIDRNARRLPTFSSPEICTQLIGVLCDRRASQKWQLPNGVGTHIDLSNNRFVMQQYDGRLLSAVSNARDFPADSALIAHLVSVISDICLLTRLARRVPLEIIGKRLRLSKAGKLTAHIQAQKEN